MQAAAVFADATYWGKGVASDDARAAAAYKIGAEAGSPHCQHALAEMYSDGRGVEQDYRQCAMWLQKSAAQGWSCAILELAAMVASGCGGLPPSFRRARELYERASGLGQAAVRAAAAQALQMHNIVVAQVRLR